MTAVATLRMTGLLLACAWCLAPVAVPAQAEPKLTKPLNLGEFARAKKAKPRVAPRVQNAQASVQSDQMLTTAVVTRKDAPLAQAASDTQASAQDSDASRFCTNIADAALDARVACQKKELEAVEAKLQVRIAELEAKRSEYEKWLKLREDFLRKAEDSVVEIYSRMNPEAAALQIASMADDTAAAVLAKLRVREASAILNEMEPARGAHLADTLAGMRRADDGKTKK